MSVERREQRSGGMQQGGPMGRGGWGAMGRPVEKPKDFKGTALRLLGYFLPQKYRLIIVLVTSIIGTAFNIVGPKILGLATTKLFNGLIAKFTALQHHLPAPGIDFGYIGRILLILLMLLIRPRLSLIVLLTIPVSLFVTMGIAKRSQNYFRSQQRALGELNGHVEEMYAGHKIVKAFGREGQSVAEFNERNEKLYNAGWRAQFVSGIIMPLMRFIGNIGYVFVAVVGGIMVTQGTIAIGDVQAFIQYAQQFTQPITQLANFANVIQSSMTSAERIFELLDEQEEVPEAVDAKVIEHPDGAVEFDHVKFGYTPDNILMKDMNINVQPGQMI